MPDFWFETPPINVTARSQSLYHTLQDEMVQQMRKHVLEMFDRVNESAASQSDLTNEKRRLYSVVMRQAQAHCEIEQLRIDASGLFSLSVNEVCVRHMNVALFMTIQDLFRIAAWSTDSAAASSEYLCGEYRVVITPGIRAASYSVAGMHVLHFASHVLVINGDTVILDDVPCGKVRTGDVIRVTSESISISSE